MSEHAQGTLKGFEEARDGAQRAIDATDRKVPDWSDQARGFLAGYILSVPYFSSEDFWQACEAAGIPRPNDRRAYGGILRGAEQRGLIRKVGTGFSKIARLHGNHIAVYERG